MTDGEHLSEWSAALYELYALVIGLLIEGHKRSGTEAAYCALPFLAGHKLLSLKEQHAGPAPVEPAQLQSLHLKAKTENRVPV